MTRVPPSRQLREAITALLADGQAGDAEIASTLLRLGAQRVVQELLEQEVTDHLDRGHYERAEATAPHRGYRNGYKQRQLRTAEGAVPVWRPQVRDVAEPFESRLWTFLRGHSDVLQRLVAEMYARGLSARDIEEALTDATGTCLLSRSAVSEITEALWEEYEAFVTRDLSGYELEYLFLDGIYETLRQQGGVQEALLCAWGIVRDGRKVLLHLGLGQKESYTCWLDFLRHMVGRGLQTPVTITSDGAPGVLRAIEEVWPQSLRLRCWVHTMRNILDKIPDSAQAEIKAHVLTIRDAPTLEAGRQAAAEVLERYSRLYPSAMASLSDDLEARLNHLRVPVNHRKYVRTTNLIERSFLEERRRTKIIPRFFDERSCLKLVFATLQRASQRWQRIRITELEQKQLLVLRQELGLDPDPTPTRRSVEVAA
ncbi:MAG: IS256 family transposase [candidate division KSB1 bacterium]|nr:IS256 family transposase [candidate division KSB1 bacterium]